MALPKFAFFKGRIVPYSEARLGILTHTFNYGTGIFGGIRGYWNDEEKELFVFRPLDHFQRFLESAKLLYMKLPYTREDLTRILIELLQAEDYHTDCYIRPLAYYADEIIGVRLFDLTADVTMASIPFGAYVVNEEGLHVATSSWYRLEDNMIPARGKIAGAYVNSALSKTEAHENGFEEALVLNQNGHVAEGSAANFFMIRRGIACTPPITDNILEGITRRTIMHLLRARARGRGCGTIHRPHRSLSGGGGFLLRHGNAAGGHRKCGSSRDRDGKDGPDHRGVAPALL